MANTVAKLVAIFCAFNTVAWSTPGYAEQASTRKIATTDQLAEIETKVAGQINDMSKRFKISTVDGHELTAADFIAQAKADVNEFRLAAKDMQIKFKSHLVEGTSQISIMMEALDEKGASFVPNRFVQFTADAKDSAAAFKMKAEDAARILAASFQTSAKQRAEGRVPASSSAHAAAQKSVESRLDELCAIFTVIGGVALIASGLYVYVAGGETKPSVLLALGIAAISGVILMYRGSVLKGEVSL